MRELTPGRIATFSLGFEDEAFNELSSAKAVADRFGTEHHEFIVGPKPEQVLPRLAWHYSEPYADSSALPTFYLAEMARRHITVALTGDGGDENFAGYRRYRAMRFVTRYNLLPDPLKASLARLGRAIPVSTSRSRRYDLKRLLESAQEPLMQRYASWFGFFADTASLLTPEFRRSTVNSAPLSALKEAFNWGSTLDTVDAVMSADISTYLADDLLVKIDIATMAHGLEARSPLLDHRVMELVARFPVNLKLRGKTHKYALKKAVDHLLPKDILSRGKLGFGVPLDRWFRTDLVPLAQDLLLSSAARQRGYFESGAIERLLHHHRTAKGAHGHRLWALVMLELWHRSSTVQARPIVVDRAGETAPAAR
jgi:asparagine synthase (glutamine-hydrolysing)